MVNFDRFWNAFDNCVFKPINLISITVSSVVLIVVGLVGMFYTAQLYLFSTILTIGLSIAASLILSAIIYAFSRCLNRSS